MPEPGTPVTSVSPRHSSQASTISAWVPRSSNPGTVSGSTRTTMLTPNPWFTWTGEMFTRKRRLFRRSSKTDTEQSIARPERRIPSPLALNIRSTRNSIAVESSAAPVARRSLPSTSIDAGEPVWKAISDAPSAAAHSRNSSSRCPGKA